MRIDVYLSEQCGSFHALRENLGAALAELGAAAEVAFHTVTYEDAVRLKLPGSPTIMIDGQDAFEGGDTPGLA